MARDKRTDQLTSATPTLLDLIAFWDVSNPGTKKMTIEAFQDLLAPVGSLTTIWVNTTASATVNVPQIIGKTVQMIVRPGGGADEIITIGIPDPSQILVDTDTGDVTAGNPWIGEKIAIQYS